MKTHNFSISLFSVLCVLCAGVTVDAFAAASVRTLGGVGTINGTSAASTSTRSAPARAGSLRVSPSSARVITSTTTSANNNAALTSGTAATSTGAGQRLSIGKYLGGATTTATTATSSSPSSTGVRKDIEDLDERIGALEDAQAAQPTYSTDGIVVVENGVVSIDMDELKKEFFGSNDNIAMEYDDQSGSIKWGIADNNGDVAEWFTLIDTSTLSGDYASEDDLETAINGLADVYLKKNDAQTIYQTIANLTQVINAESTATQYPSAKAVYDALASVSGSAANVEEKISDAIGSLGAYETVEEALAAKQNTLTFDNAPTEDSTNPVTSGGVYTALAAKQNTIDSEHKLPASNVSGLADVATGGEFMDLDDVKTATNLEYIEVGEVEGNDGAAWIWGYVNGEPTFIRVVGKNGQ